MAITSTPQSRREKLYGSDFPERPSSMSNGEDWRSWIDERLNSQEPKMQSKRLHWARHRHFRAGRQWISTRDNRTWRELDSDENKVRAVMNLIGPALDFRLGLLVEQRPGFKAQPLGTGIKARETAEAQQNVVKYYYRKLGGEKLLRDAAACAQTDGACFLHVFADKDAEVEPQIREVSPDDPDYDRLVRVGYELDGENNVIVPLDDEGAPKEPGEDPATITRADIGTRVVLAQEVFADPEAKTVNGPYDEANWVILRRTRDLKAARRETGNEDLEADAEAQLGDPVLGTSAQGYQRGLPTYPQSRRTPTDEVVFDFLVFIAPDDEAGIDRGLWRRIIGDTVVDGGDVLPGGKIPLARMPDGSPDNDFFPRPQMADWIPDQLAINALVSKLIEHVRVFGTGRIMAQEGTVLDESYTDVVGSVINWRGTKPDIESGVRVSSDAWSLLQFMVQKLEDKTGWTDLARGAVTGTQGGGMQDVAGRGILAARELFERQFGPMVRAAARGMSDWAELVVDYARFLFDDDEGRLIPRAGREDLADRISGSDLGDESLVFVDPETLRPLPRALRNQMLFDLLQQGLITPEEYRKRAPFAELRNVTMGSTQQWERAQMVNSQIEENADRLAQLDFAQRFEPDEGGLALWWQDDPSVHMRALNEIVLDDQQEQVVRELAAERWTAYAQLAQAHQGAARPPEIVSGAPAQPQAQPGGAQAQGEQGAQPGGEAAIPGREGTQPTSPAPASGPVAPSGTPPRGGGLEQDLQQ